MGNQNKGYITVATSSTVFGRTLPMGQRVLQEDVNHEFLLTQEVSSGDSLDTTTNIIVTSGLVTAGIIGGGIITINGGDNTKFDMAQGVGVVMDYVDEDNPVLRYIRFGPFTAVALDDISKDFTLISIDKTGAIEQVPGGLESDSIRRTNIRLQGIVHVAGTIIESISNRTDPAIDFVKSIADVVEFLPPLTTGNLYSSTGANLSLQRSAGTSRSLNNNYRGPSRLTPSLFTSALQDPVTPWIRHLQDGSGGFLFLLGDEFIDPEQFDDGDGSLDTVPVGKYTTKLLYQSPETGANVEVYGQTIYGSISEAQADIPFQIINVDPTLTSVASLRNFLIIKKGTTSIENASDALIVPNRFSNFKT